MGNREALSRLIDELWVADMKGIVPPPVSMPLRTYVDMLRDAHKALDRIVELEAVNADLCVKVARVEALAKDFASREEPDDLCIASTVAGLILDALSESVAADEETD